MKLINFRAEGRESVGALGSHGIVDLGARLGHDVTDALTFTFTCYINQLIYPNLHVQPGFVGDGSPGLRYLGRRLHQRHHRLGIVGGSSRAGSGSCSSNQTGSRAGPLKLGVAV